MIKILGILSKIYDTIKLSGAGKHTASAISEDEDIATIPRILFYAVKA